MRAISVAIAVQGLRDVAGDDPRAVPADRHDARRAARLCWRDRSRFSSANNHLLGELAGVATVGILFPELAGAQRWERAALAALPREADRQILPDGAGAEQSSAYLVFSAELLLVPRRPPAAAGRPAARGIAAACGAAPATLPTSSATAIRLPRYGDEDDGFALRLHPEPVATLERHLGWSRPLTGGPRAAGVADLTARWFGASARTGDQREVAGARRGACTPRRRPGRPAQAGRRGS